MKKVYFDNAATTELRKEVVHTMTNVLKTEYGNPSSTHSYGRSSKSLLESCRKDIAKLLNASPSEIIFTSGGTEADNLIINSCVCDLGVERIITSRIEHHAVLHTVENLQQTKEIEVAYVSVNVDGTLDFGHLESLLQHSSKATLVSLMHINNEIGTILPLKETAKLCKKYGAFFHSDTVQSVGHYPLDFSEIPIDFAVGAAHKFHGPKGIGFAYVRKNMPIQPLIHGGGQERGLRAGTEAVYAIAGMTEALKIAIQNLNHEEEYILSLKEYFKQELLREIPGVTFNGNCANSSASSYTLLNIGLPITSEKGLMLTFQMDLKGIACSQGSACQSGSNVGSHVLQALLLKGETQKPSIRFSFSSFNTKEEVDYVVSVLKEFVTN
ncbi:MAG TPA: cysteine desulfurase family protein [Flavobacteriaceae bacterium]|nr:cysteine desulfurase [Flavobacteriaceae bacterium]MCB9213231.1 cysteine desulfurase [Alteromonas sp.]HPF10097.1 cysteine desulfurase family protein [Flavobacteriaceae bacterium]HQU22586.1 cysteine desulfurase family protein [Flavobacteriaceae bacterium]HQU66411.1 cysteine desulfurase family protein [Flavobacteriaceae bacterium]